MRTYTRKQDWKVTIKRPDYTQDKLVYKKVSDWTKNNIPTTKIDFVSSGDKANASYAYTDIISYEFDSTIASPSDAFSLSFTAVQDIKGLSWKDKIRARDMVFIEEFGKVRYIGIVKNTSYQSNINGGKPTRSVTVSGQSIGGMLQTFQLPMNAYLWSNLGTTADIASKELIDALSSKIGKNQTVADILQRVQDKFIEVALTTTSGFAVLLNKYLTLESNLKIRYPMAIKVFQEENNTLWSIFRLILPLPIYEVFGRYENSGYNLICRETPFDYNSWNNLKLNKLESLFLVEHSLSDSDDEVYTHFYSQMPNSVLSQEENWANNSLNEVSVFDEEKKDIYGFRQLSANFPFFNLDEKEAFTETDAKEFLKENSVRMYAWYKNNDEFLSGKITNHTVPDSDNNYPLIGERLQYMQGSSNSIEFYIEGVKRKTVYGGMSTSTYSVTRGYEYSSTPKSVIVDGVTVETPQAKRVSQLGKKLKQTEITEAQIKEL